MLVTSVPRQSPSDVISSDLSSSSLSRYLCCLATLKNNNTIVVHYKSIDQPESQAIQQINNELIQSKQQIATDRCIRTYKPQ